MARPAVKRHSVLYDIPFGLSANIGPGHRAWGEVGRWIADTMSGLLAEEAGTVGFILEVNTPHVSEADDRLGEIGLQMSKQKKGKA